MSKPVTSALVLGMVVAAAVATMSSFAKASDLLPVLAPARHAACWCGPCGCLHVGFVHHPELRTTYGSGFDPRNDDTTEPHYYFGPVRAYPRYWVTVDDQ